MPYDAAALAKISEYFKNGDPNGSRTRVSTVKEWCPRPLDDGVVDCRNKRNPAENQLVK